MSVNMVRVTVLGELSVSAKCGIVVLLTNPSGSVSFPPTPIPQCLPTRTQEGGCMQSGRLDRKR